MAEVLREHVSLLLRNRENRLLSEKEILLQEPKGDAESILWELQCYYTIGNLDDIYWEKLEQALEKLNAMNGKQRCKNCVAEDPRGFIPILRGITQDQLLHFLDSMNIGDIDISSLKQTGEQSGEIAYEKYFYQTYNGFTIGIYQRKDGTYDVWVK